MSKYCYNTMCAATEKSGQSEFHVAKMSNIWCAQGTWAIKGERHNRFYCDIPYKFGKKQEVNQDSLNFPRNWTLFWLDMKYLQDSLTAKWTGKSVPHLVELEILEAFYQSCLKTRFHPRNVYHLKRSCYILFHVFLAFYYTLCCKC